ncbi:MAG: glycosyltransferase family 2 protein [Opitutus sp.]|nr:glycosyltransferase family 2 protein [Opitutus sp.]
MSARVIAIIPAFHRPQLLARALRSLAGQGPLLARVVVVNNSSDAETARLTAESRVPATLLDYGCNLGTAGGIAAGMAAMLQDLRATHAFVMDDDACATPDLISTMLRAAEESKAEAVAPLITDGSGTIRWFPGPLAQPAWNVVRRSPTPAEFLRQCGPAPLEWNWAIWAAVLFSRRAIEAVGYPRMDLWSQSTDLEYTLRVSARFKCVLAPAAVCQHLPPPAPDGGEGKKLFLGLQSGNYISFRLRHGWRFIRHIPGQHYRYLRHYRWRLRAWKEAAVALVGGAVLGRTPGNTARRADYLRAVEKFPEGKAGAGGERRRAG